MHPRPNEALHQTGAQSIGFRARSPSRPVGGFPILSRPPAGEPWRWAETSIENQSLISQGAQAMSAKPQTIGEYLAPLSNEKRAALEKFRRASKSAAPKAEECISYQIPAVRLGGRMLAAFGAAAEPLRLLPRCFPRRSPPGRTQGLRHQQGHHPLSSGSSLTGHTGADAGKDSDRGARRPTIDCGGRRYAAESERWAVPRVLDWCRF